MMTNAMTCDLFLERLPAYMEGEDDAAGRATMERHAATCVDCGAVLADLRKIRADAAQLPELAPSRDLWAGIAARIEAPVLPLQAPVARRRTWPRSVLRVGLLAASLVAAAGLGYRFAARRTLPQAPAVATRDVTPAVVVARADSAVQQPVQEPAPGPASRVATPRARPAANGAMQAQLAVATLTADYDREIASLRALINRRRNQMDPATVAVIEKNLQVIDAAIADSRKAIAADPSSAFLIESLNQSLRTKVELMRTAAALPIRM